MSPGKQRRAAGFSLIEVLIALSILAVVATTMTTLITATLRAMAFTSRQNELAQTARLAMERMAAYTRRANRLLLPLANNPTRNLLALGGFIDNDGDGKYDEDPPEDLTADGAAGIIGIDDDGDGQVDEGSAQDDDEDGLVNEDPKNGIDDDGDGNVDEEGSLSPLDDDADGSFDEDPINGLDDDLDLAVDEDPPNTDDDGDGLYDEDPVEPIVYYLDVATKTLRERYPINATTFVTNILAEYVETFQVQRLVGANGAIIIDMLLRLRDPWGNEVELQTRVLPRNLGN